MGVAKLPIVLGIGASLTPSLRSRVVVDNATSLTVSKEDLPALRFHGFIALDLTLLPF